VIILDDNKHVISASLDGCVLVWDIEKKRRVSRLVLGRVGCEACTVCKDGDSLYTLGTHGVIQRFSISREMESGQSEGIASSILCMSPDDSMLVSSDKDCDITQWETKRRGGAILTKKLPAHSTQIKCACWSDDSAILLTAGVDGSVMIWEK
ncbi:hypothetical protein ADUPG1_000027, partial [Aduncisulcus paluster]